MPRETAFWFFLLVTSSLYLLSDPTADNDLWVHLKSGLFILESGAVPRTDVFSYTAAGHPWVDHEWLSQVLLAWIYGTFGSRGLFAWKLVLGLLALALLAADVLRTRLPLPLRVVLLVLGLSVLSRGFAPRPQIFTYAALAGLFFVLRRTPSPSPWALALAFALWANLHGGVLAGLGVLGVRAVWNAFVLRSEARRSALGCLAALLAFLFLNPYGPSLGLYVREELFFPHPITEWQPLALEPAQGTFLLLAGGFVLTLFRTEFRGRGWEAGLGVLFLVFAFRHQRHTPLFALAALPLLAENLERFLASPPPAFLRFGRTLFLSEPARRILLAGVAAVSVLQLSLLIARAFEHRFRIVYDRRDYPVGAVTYLRECGIGGNAAVPLDWGGYVLWHLSPDVRVSLDGRFATVYPVRAVRDNFDFFAGERVEGFLRRYETDLVFAPTGSPLDLSRVPGWHPIFRDDTCVLWARTPILEKARSCPPVRTPRSPRLFFP